MKINSLALMSVLSLSICSVASAQFPDFPDPSNMGMSKKDQKKLNKAMKESTDQMSDAMRKAAGMNDQSGDDNSSAQEDNKDKNIVEVTVQAGETKDIKVKKKTIRIHGPAVQASQTLVQAPAAQAQAVPATVVAPVQQQDVSLSVHAGETKKTVVGGVSIEVVGLTGDATSDDLIASVQNTSLEVLAKKLIAKRFGNGSCYLAYSSSGWYMLMKYNSTTSDTSIQPGLYEIATGAYNNNSSTINDMNYLKADLIQAIKDGTCK